MNMLKQETTLKEKKKETTNLSVEECNTKKSNWCKTLVETSTFKSNTNSKFFKNEHNMT